MANGAWTLREYPLDLIRISCAKCARAGQYHRAKLIDHFGPDMTMPELRHELAQCHRRHTMNDPCMVILRIESSDEDAELKAAIQAGKTLVLDIQFIDGHQTTRYPAALGWCGKSLIWADTGWPMTPGHAFHRFRGKLTGKGPWTLRPADATVVVQIVVREMMRGEQPATDEYLIWRDYRATREGQPYDNAAAMKAAAELPLAA